MEWQLTSPSGATTVTVTHHPEGTVTYRVVSGDVTVIEDARLGLATAEDDLTTLFPVSATTATIVASAFTLPHGKRRTSRIEMAQRVIRFAGRDAVPVEVVMCAAEDGVAFRYRSPTPVAPVRVIDEITEFRFAAPGRVWVQRLQPPGHAAPAYEETFTNGAPLDDPGSHQGWVFPALFEVAGRWVLLTEAGSDPGYTNTQLAGPAGRTYTVAFPHPGEALGVGAAHPTVSGAWQTPWRVILTGPTPGTILESDLVRHLSRPGAPADVSWVRPGRVAWSWWSDHDSPGNMQTQRRYVDFAAEMGWEHILVDANWSRLPDSEIVDLVAYAAACGVGVFLWYNSGGPNNAVTEQPRDRMYDATLRRAELGKLARWGVAGIKVDFFHSDKQTGVRHFHDILEDAAAERVMVNFHGCTVPRGWDRTWPHLMTMEGVAGAEQYSFRDTFPVEAPVLNTILPFTRNVPGSMDYTPVTFSDAESPHLTTNAHELALSVVFESGLQHFADSATSYRSQPEAVVDFLRSVPAVWDDTRWLGGEPGDHVVVARRHGATWFVAGISGRDAPHLVTVRPPLDAGTWTIDLIGDGDDPHRFAISHDTIDGVPVLTVAMATRGGFAARLTPV